MIAFIYSMQLDIEEISALSPIEMSEFEGIIPKEELIQLEELI
jgi:hypothetical protein